MRRIVLVVALVVSVGGVGFGQQAVAVVSSSPEEKTYFFQDVAKQIQNVQNSVDQLIRLNSMITNQTIALQKMTEGDWQSFVEGYSYQTAAINNFSGLTTNFGEGIGKNMDAMEELTQDPGFQDFQKSSELMSDSVTASNQLLRTTNVVIQSSQRRMEQFKQIREGSASGEGMVEQLQAQNQALQLLGYQLADMKMLSYAANTYYETRARNEEMRAEMAEKKAERQRRQDNDVSRNEYSDAEMRELVRGGNNDLGDDVFDMR